MAASNVPALKVMLLNTFKLLSVTESVPLALFTVRPQKFEPPVILWLPVPLKVTVPELLLNVPELEKLPDMDKVPLVELKVPPDAVKSSTPIGPEPAENVPDD